LSTVQNYSIRKKSTVKAAKNKTIDHCFRLDFLVENDVIIELKSLEKVLPVHEAQLLTYLRLAKKQVGLLINFNVPILKQGIHRCISNANNIPVNSCSSTALG